MVYMLDVLPLPHMPPICSHGSVVASVCHIRRFCAMFSVILYSFIASLMFPVIILLDVSLLVCPCTIDILLVVSILPFLPQYVAISYQSSRSEDVVVGLMLAFFLFLWYVIV